MASENGGDEGDGVRNASFEADRSPSAESGLRFDFWNEPELERRLRLIQKARKARGIYFDPKLFADPAWDIMLELFRAHVAQVKVSVSSVCIAAEVPPTTALRWLDTLERRGIIRRSKDVRDGRRTIVLLTNEALLAMHKFISSAPPNEPLI